MAAAGGGSDEGVPEEATVVGEGEGEEEASGEAA